MSSLAQLHCGVQQPDQVLLVGMALLSPPASQGQPVPARRGRKKYADEALSALTAVLSKGTGKCSSTQIHRAQNNPQQSGAEQEQTVREWCRPCTLSSPVPSHTAERWKRQKKGPAWQKAVIRMQLFPCSAPAPLFMNSLQATGCHPLSSCMPPQRSVSPTAPRGPPFTGRAAHHFIQSHPVLPPTAEAPAQL